MTIAIYSELIRATNVSLLALLGLQRSHSTKYVHTDTVSISTVSSAKRCLEGALKLRLRCQKSLMINNSLETLQNLPAFWPTSYFTLIQNVLKTD